MMKRLALICVLAAAAAACTRKNPEFCTSTADCMDPAKPFCDVNGSFGDLMNDCIATPMDAGVPDAPPGGCTAGAALDCTGETLTSCGSDGNSTTASNCPLGCATGAVRCLAFEPSNGLGSALADATSEMDVILPAGTRIDVDLGLVEDSGGSPISVTSRLVAQTGGLSIRVFLGKSFVIDDTVIHGSLPVAFVAPGRISVIGYLDASANAGLGGPGAISEDNVCIGVTHFGQGLGFFATGGGGGGGNATNGGDGGEASGTHGAAIDSLSPLAGGCSGGDQAGSGSSGITVSERGGGGGGGVQLDSLTTIALSSRGLVDVGGGGGQPYAGGGAGGNIVLEAPAISIDGAATGLAASGGAGGACNLNGADGGTTSATAAGPTCTPKSGGDGGVALVPARSGENCTSSCQLTEEGGGGGAAGRARLATKDGTYATTANPVLSAVLSTAALVIQ